MNLLLTMHSALVTELAGSDPPIHSFIPELMENPCA